MDVSTENVFADLGLENSGELLARAQLLLKVGSFIKDSGLPQKEIAEKLGVSQLEVSMLVSGKLTAFSIETLSLIHEKVMNLPNRLARP